MAKNFKKKRLFTVAALTVLLALAMLVFAACETGKTYTLTFETGNGSAVSPIKAKAGDKIDLPDEPTLDGHRFDGWYLSEDFSGEKAALPETMPAENRTYYAKFTAIKTATLTLDAAGGVLETSVFELEAGEKVWRIASQAVPSLTGAVFGGWFNGNSAVTENTVMPANGLTLTARYKASYVVEVYLEDLNGEYIGEACKIARKYFKVIGLEVYPMNSDEYAYLHECGADYVTVFQETYNSDKYETLHLAGHKRIFPYRVNAQERALKGGMRGVGFAALLGLDDFRKDALATGYHAYLLQKKYPRAEIAFSCPRLCPIINNDRINPKDVHETQLLQVVCAYRLFMPFASITISTREVARVRDNLVNIAATKISAGVSTGIGSHVDDIEDKGDDQFEISDGRSVDEVFNALLDNGLQPVMSDYIYV